MTLFNCSCNCNCKCTCTVAAIILSAIVGVIATILQITGAFALTPVIVGTAFGIAIVYLGILAITAALAGRNEGRSCFFNALNTLLAGILGTIALAAIITVAGAAAAVVISAILTGLLLFFLTLTIVATACLVRYLTDCRS